MANVYFKIINKNISRSFTEQIISGLQRELSDSTKILNEDLFDATRLISTRRSGLDVDSLLKYYVINQILKEVPENKPENKTCEQYLPTANENFHKNSSDNKYYKKSGDKWILAEAVTNVYSDGSYEISEKKNNSTYTFKKVFDIEDSLISVQVISHSGSVVKSMEQVVELMNLKKEFARRFKYSGYSGNSNDIVAAVLNKFSSPVETGYYMDQRYNLYRWDSRKKCLIKSYDDCNQAPLLTDYEFSNSKKVIRKEYTGIR